LATLAVGATCAVMPYRILMLAIVGVTPAVIVLAAIGANVYWIALTTRSERCSLSPCASDGGADHAPACAPTAIPAP
jgi:hypothetical protein